jgi:cytoskeleton protein RodZ
VSSFGAQLRQERERQGVTLEDISLTTKIGTRMLRALEEEHFDQLPGGIFNKGFIRAYARCLGMDEDQAVADYLTATGVTQAKKFEIDEAPPILEPPPREENPATGLPWGTFAVLLLIVALGFAGWGFYSRESQKTEDSAPPAANSTSTPPPAAAESAPEQKPPESTNSPAPIPKPAEAKPATALANASAPSPPDGTPATSESAVQPRPAAPANGAFVVSIKARTDYSWLSISVDGEIVTRAMLTAPAEKSVRAENQIVIRAGNVGALDFEFNGTKLPTQGDYGEAKTLIFDAHGLRTSVPKPESPTPKPEPPTQLP